MIFRNICHYLSHMRLNWGKKICPEADILDRAHADGGQNLPSTHDVDHNRSQKAVIDRANDQIAQLRQHVVSTVQSCDRLLGEHDPTFSNLDVATPVNAAVHELKKLRIENKAKLHELQRTIEERHRDLCLFKAANNLTRRASYPQSGVLALSVLFLLIMVESVLNAQLFAETNVRGLLGGWLVAVPISLVNVSFPTLVGVVALRKVFHARESFRFPARVVFVLFVVIIVAFNAYASYYRMTLSVDPGIEHVVLFFVGLFAATIGLVDGYCLLDDRYAEYGAVDRRYRKALAEREKAHEHCRKEIKREVDLAVSSLETNLARFDKKAAVASRLINTATACIMDCEERVLQVARRCDFLIKVYREENCKLRATPAPVYFNDNHRELVTDLNTSAPDLFANKSMLRDAVAAKHEETEQAITAIREMGEHYIAELDGFTAVVVDNSRSRQLTHRDEDGDDEPSGNGS